MADVVLSANRGRKVLWSRLKVDMTPMVDLGFLLITFFIFTTSLMEPTVMTLAVPADGKPTPVPESKVMTVLPDKENRVYYYEGKWEDASQNGKVFMTGYNYSSGIGQKIREKQRALTRVGSKEDLVLIIKPLNGSSYKNFIDLLDETKINNVSRYITVDPAPAELEFLAKNGVGRKP